MSVLDTNSTKQYLDDVVELNKKLIWSDHWSKHIGKLYDKLTNQILGNGYYNMCSDSWSCTEETYNDCIKVIESPLIKWLIKRKVRKMIGFDTYKQ